MIKLKMLAGVVIGIALLWAADIANELRIGKITLNVGKYGRTESVSRTEDPERFRGALGYEVFRVVGTMGLGLAFLAWARKLERLDPLSPKFQGQQSLDELAATLNEEQSEEGPDERTR